MKYNLGIFLIVALLAFPQPSTAQDLVPFKRQMIQQSIQRYPGNCPCPYNRASNGSRCGGRSAWSRPGGRSPICFAEDITDSMVRSWMARNNMQVTRPSTSIQDSTRETVRRVQVELNRLGCELGKPDGIVGPNSRSAMADFSAARRIELSMSNFRSQLFLRRLQGISLEVCRS